MEITAKLAGDLEIRSIKHYSETNARIANLALHVKMAKERAAELFGEDTAEQFFCNLKTDDGEGNVVWGFKSLIPDLAFSKHSVKIHDVGEFGVVPELKRVKPSDSGPQVTVTFEFPIEVSDKKKIGALAIKVGDVVRVDMEPQQMSLPGVATEPVVIKKAGKHGNAIPQPAQPTLAAVGNDA